jgi:DNA modification methylase
VRAIMNGLKLGSNSLILDPFNGCGTTTHEASLMGIRSVGLDVTPVGDLTAEVKNSLPFLEERDLTFSNDELSEIVIKIKDKKWENEANNVVYLLMLLLYLDALDLLQRKGLNGPSPSQLTKVFIRKLEYVLSCHRKLNKLRESLGLRLSKAKIIECDTLDIKKKMEWMHGAFDAVITSPPYYLSLDYVEKDREAYRYLNLDIEKIKAKQLGIGNTRTEEEAAHNWESEIAEQATGFTASLPPSVVRYYSDLRLAISNIFWCLKKNGQLAIIVGDSLVMGKRIPTTYFTKRICEDMGFAVKRTISNPLLGSRNQSIRGETIVICEK